MTPKLAIVLIASLAMASCSMINGSKVTSQQEFKLNNATSGIKAKIQVGVDGSAHIIDSKGRRIDSICSELRLQGGYELHEYSKQYLLNYYKSRKLTELFIAWYFSEDSKFLALSVRKCPDKENRHFYALQTLLRKNSIIQDLITVNMRTNEHANLNELYMDEYYKLFPKDIK